jgi:hypothetical protein
MKKLRLSLFAIALTLGISALPLTSQTDNGKLFTTQKASASSGGPIVLDGMDPVCHSGYESTGQYIARVLKKVHDGASNLNNGRIAILGSNSGSNSCGAPWSEKIVEYTSEFGTAPAVDFYTTNASISTFFDSTITSAQPALIWIPDNWSRSSVIEATFTANAEKIADFVNSGGGLFANMGSYGWLTALLPNAVYNNGGCNGGPEAATDGVSDFNLNNAIVAACWHGYFTGDVGTLKVLVDYPYPTASSTRKAVSVGGGSVSLPSSFTLAITPETPRAGEDLTITATAQTLAGVPQAGVTVTVTVSSGPDAGQTLTATTNASGIATITVRTNSVGTAVYTATATVNGVAKTVSSTVTWDVPTTTTAPPTITTLVPETTTTAAPVTTTVAPTTTPAPATTVAVTAPIPTNPPNPPNPPSPPTTVHDHSTHSHGPSGLPQTGLNGMLIVFGFIFFLLGLGTLKNKKK